MVPDPAKPDLPFFDDFEPSPFPPPDLDPTEQRKMCTLEKGERYVPLNGLTV